MTVQIVNSGDARKELSEIIDTAFTGAIDYVIKRYRKPRVVVISYEDYVAVRPRLEILRAARRAVEGYRAYLANPDAARPLAEVARELELEAELAQGLPLDRDLEQELDLEGMMDYAECVPGD